MDYKEHSSHDNSLNESYEYENTHKKKIKKKFKKN